MEVKCLAMISLPRSTLPCTQYVNCSIARLFTGKVYSYARCVALLTEYPTVSLQNKTTLTSAHNRWISKDKACVYQYHCRLHTSSCYSWHWWVCANCACGNWGDSCTQYGMIVGERLGRKAISWFNAACCIDRAEWALDSFVANPPSIAIAFGGHIEAQVFQSKEHVGLTRPNLMRLWSLRRPATL
jgi:hypothetical protein